MSDPDWDYALDEILPSIAEQREELLQELARISSPAVAEAVRKLIASAKREGRDNQMKYSRAGVLRDAAEELKDKAMGMFDWVKYEDLCPCGEQIALCQSKDGDCTGAILEPYQVGSFYHYCKCGRWIDYKVTIEQPVRYGIERTVTTREERGEK